MKALQQIVECIRRNPDEAFAMATLVEAQGSTYRKPGARMLIDSDGGTIGVLSGGCLEEVVARHGREIIAGVPPALLEFDTRRFYGCDGRVRIFIERIPAAGGGANVLTQLGVAFERRQYCRLLTCYEGEAIGTMLLEKAELVAERSGVFVQCVPLPIRVLLFGCGPEIEPIRQIAQALGWIVHTFTHVAELPDRFLADAQTAAVVMTHHFGRDLTALHRLLPMQLAYVGLLGPRKRHHQLLQELHASCTFNVTNLAALHAPAGLDVGSEAPEEIALAITAEVSAVLAERHGGHLRDRATAIHFAGETGAVRVA